MSALVSACVTVLSMPAGGVPPQVSTTKSPFLALAGKATRTNASLAASVTSAASYRSTSAVVPLGPVPLIHGRINPPDNSDSAFSMLAAATFAASGLSGRTLSISNTDLLTTEVLPLTVKVANTTYWPSAHLLSKSLLRLLLHLPLG